MRIAIYGATGMIGQRVTREALARGHSVIAIVRNVSRFDLRHPNLDVKEGDVLDATDIAAKVVGCDAVVNATRQFYADAPAAVGQTFVDAAHALIDGMKQAGGTRLVVVGGAGSLEIEPGKLLMDSEEFPQAHLSVARSLRDALAVYQTADMDWSFFSPAPRIAPGERTGRYRTGTDRIVEDENGQSRISAEDYAMALVDELEQPRFLRQRFTAAY